jgi:hypothetical protein
MRRSAYVLALVTLSAGFASSAFAEDVSTVVLGLRSAEGDDDLANSMTDALRTMARNVSGWKVVERAVSMSQMSLAHGCDDIDAPCLSEIAKGLQADRLLFGTLRRVGPKGKFDFEVSVSIFNAGTRTIGKTETAVIPRADARTKKALVSYAEPLVAKLSAADAGSGVLSLQVNVASAEVKLDGQVVGQTRDKHLQLEGMKEGDHRLEVTALGHLTHNQQILVASGQRTEIKVNLEPVPEPEVVAAPALAVATEEPVEEVSSGSLSWLGYTLIGVGAASFAGWGVSMYMVDSTNKNPAFVEYKSAFPESADDVCDLADNGDTAGGTVSASELAEVQSLCSRGRTFNMLQWVFLGAGVLTASVGTFILVSESGGEEHAQAKKRPTLTLTPQFDHRSFALQTKLRF